jgi:predicted RNA-binding Zn ribbon-like protein
VVFAHDTEMALQAAAWLANSAEDPDTLTSLDELRAHLVEFDYSVPRAATRVDLEEIRALRPRLRAMLTAERDDAAALVNETLRQAHACPRLVRHDPVDWHLHAVSDDEPLATRVAVDTAMALVDVVRADEMSRLSVCDLDDCAGVVVDLTRNRSRRFCSTGCGNRAAVAAYRERQRSMPDMSG